MVPPATGKLNICAANRNAAVIPTIVALPLANQVGKKIPVAKDRWICAEFMLAHNTPGKADGEQAFWIDGVLRGHWRGIHWRTSPTLWANAFTLESYVTDRWTKQRQNIVQFDNVVIAKDYIGPAKRE